MTQHHRDVDGADDAHHAPEATFAAATSPGPAVVAPHQRADRPEEQRQRDHAKAEHEQYHVEPAALQPAGALKHHRRKRDGDREASRRIALEGETFLPVEALEGQRRNPAKLHRLAIQTAGEARPRSSRRYWW